MQGGRLSMRLVTVAATQFACTWDLPVNADRAEALVRQAAGQGANVVLVQELFGPLVTQRALNAAAETHVTQE